jgi:hypothetical protein
MASTVENARAAIVLHQAEIKHLLSQTPVDTLAIEQLQVACVRELKVIRSAQHLVDTATANRSNRIQEVLDQLFPRTFSPI